MLPPLVLLLTRAFLNCFYWQELVVALLLWLPLDFCWMAEVWSWPNGQLAYSLNALVSTCLGGFSLDCLRGLDGIG